MQHKKAFFLTIDIDLNVWNFLTVYQRSMWLNSLTDRSHFIGILHIYNLQTVIDHQNHTSRLLFPFISKIQYYFLPSVYKKVFLYFLIRSVQPLQPQVLFGWVFFK